MPPKTLAKAGLVALVVAVLVAYGSHWWLKTRNFTPVDMPVPPNAGMIKTPPFEINLREVYSVYIYKEYGVGGWERRECDNWNVPERKWKVYRFAGWDGKRKELWANALDPLPADYFRIGFHASPGKYQLEWDVAPWASCLNGRHSRLRVETDSEIYQEGCALILSVCLFIGGTGTMLVLRALGLWLLAMRKKATLRMLPELALTSVLPLQRHPPVPLAKDLPNFGLAFAGLLCPLLFIFMAIMPPGPRGLLVGIRERSAVALQDSPSAETLAVYVDGHGEFYLNGQKVVPKDLQAKLREELGKRLSRVVYFEADADSRYFEAVEVFDTIQEVGGKVVWITPQIRKELNRQPAR